MPTNLISQTRVMIENGEREKMMNKKTTMLNSNLTQFEQNKNWTRQKKHTQKHTSTIHFASCVFYLPSRNITFAIDKENLPFSSSVSILRCLQWASELFWVFEEREFSSFFFSRFHPCFYFSPSLTRCTQRRTRTQRILFRKYKQSNLIDKKSTEYEDVEFWDDHVAWMDSFENV